MSTEEVAALPVIEKSSHIDGYFHKVWTGYLTIDEANDKRTTAGRYRRCLIKSDSESDNGSDDVLSEVNITGVHPLTLLQEMTLSETI